MPERYARGGLLGMLCSSAGPGAAVVLTNPKEVNAEWEVRKPLEKARDWGFFTYSPASGSLAPGAKQQLQVTSVSYTHLTLPTIYSV